MKGNQKTDPVSLAIIPARGGSKRIPRKNLRILAGKPLIAWTIETALASQMLGRVIVITDDPEIASVARGFGAEIPFMQPPELAQDHIADFPVCRYTLQWLLNNDAYNPDFIVWLRPTAPLRRIDDIDGAILKLIETGADCVRSVTAVEQHPYWMKRLENDRLLPFLRGKDEKTYYQRQLLPALYYLNGAVDVTKTSNVLKKGFIFGGDMRAYVMPPERSVDLDSELDFGLAETIMQKRDFNDNSSC